MMQQASEPAMLGPLLQAFFTEHLISHRLASPQTVDGYRDTFRLLLEFLRRTKGKEPSALDGIEASGGLGKISAQGVAGSREGVQPIRSGKMLSSSAQMPGEIGRVAVQVAIDHFAENAVAKDIHLPVKLVTRTNADEFIQ
jgi:hypothetical protein